MKQGLEFSANKLGQISVQINNLSHLHSNKIFRTLIHEKHISMYYGVLCIKVPKTAYRMNAQTFQCNISTCFNIYYFIFVHECVKNGINKASL